MIDRDIVYILKREIDPGELRYSLRSVAENFPARSVWFVCGCPEGFAPDVYIDHEQTGGTKWERVRSSMIEVCKRPDLSEDFFLFNDDFFVLKEQTGEFVNMTDGTIGRRINEIKHRFGGSSAYTTALKELDNLLKYKGFDTISFAVHVPFLVNKYKMLELLTSRNNNKMFRGLYGNIYKVPYIYHKDVKIYDMQSTPGDDWEYLSTTEQAFAWGAVGEWLRDRFPNPCKYEKDGGANNDKQTGN